MKAIITDYYSRNHEEVEHEVLYVEYRGEVPFEVVTAMYVPKATCGPYWRIYHWDFFLNMRYEDDLRYYNCGSGGSINDGITAPQFVSPVEVWISDKIKFNGKPANAILLGEPKGNPFENAGQSLFYSHCERCGMDVDNSDFNSVLPCGCGEYDDDGNILYYEA